MADQRPDPFAPRTMKRKNVKGLALKTAPKAPAGGLGMRREEPTQLEIGIEFNLDLKAEDLEVIKDLGAGNGGTVSKVRHIPTNTVMARKIIHVEAKKEMRKRIVRELQIMHGCHSEYIVTFYGAFLNENNDVVISLDRISKKFGPIRVDVLGKIAEATLGGLTYLYAKHHIMHRDIKPSNILVNSRGQIKLCDFGVSGELINSIADTFVGTSTYMAPERIQGEKYTVKSDVWSFGLTIMELAIGKFPFSASEEFAEEDSGPAGILDLLQQIVHEPAPRLPKSDAFPQILEDMIQKCLSKVPDERPTPQELYDRDPFIQAAKRTPVNLQEWACGLIERDNRKSHLQPQPSPSTQELLRSSDSPTYHGDASGSTPTYRDHRDHRDYRDHREHREHREHRDPRDYREQHRDYRDYRDHRGYEDHYGGDHRDYRDYHDARGDYHDSRGYHDERDPREYVDPRDHRYAVDQAGLPAQMDRLYIRDWDHE
ncbi:MAP kinase kinase-like protein [Thermochaetoides thermophila DSM 1495]|uniref:MAP kinase kinase-like protein n=1 Tax=Chaetomium thermophilum (strain DSM 1495 / CBS 144.50 / IMI 039719) TaxID=759272 RepID=G0SDA6_CHATD|nr:MAP kinase kinase-like protein [Thermochaetoides thermophila DSM 1495]EGS18507.1 MAP kinase kinase-like protein [Thermochaetoides thermophila DSM 1495]